MTRQELVDAVAEVLGIHATEERVGTIVLLADAYAAGDSEDVTALRRQVLASRPAPPPAPPQEAAWPECRCGCGRPAVYLRCRLALACYQRWRAHGYPEDIPAPFAFRAARIESYLELRAWGLTRPQAAQRLGVTVRTIWRYEHDLARAGTPC